MVFVGNEINETAEFGVGLALFVVVVGFACLAVEMVAEAMVVMAMVVTLTTWK